MIFVTAEQRTDEWYAGRLGRATASRAKDITAYSSRAVKNKETGEKYFPELKARSDYRRELVSERLIGVLGRKDVFVNSAMQWGITNESLARTNYMLMTKNKVTEEGFAQHDELMSGCSTDGLVNTNGNLEIKCLEPYNHLYEIVKHGELPYQFRDQVQFQLWITERKFCDFVGYDSRQPAGLDMFAVRVERDEEHIAYLGAETRKFLAEVDEDMAYFLQFLPYCDRTCRQCGVIFQSKITICPDCTSPDTVANKVIEPAVRSLNRIPTTK